MNQEEYLKRFVIPRLQKITGNKLISVVLFGSIIDKVTWSESDFDVLFIFDDSITKDEMRRAEIFIRATLDYRRLKRSKGILTRLLRGLENETGMYVSGFLTRKSDFLNWNFPRIFGLNRIMAKILAPANAVKYTIMKRYRVIYGEDLVKKLSLPEVKVSDLIRSLIMNLLLSIGAFIISPHKESPKYSLEAIKWSIYAATYAIDSKPHLYAVGEILAKWGVKYIKKYFIPARKSGKPHALVTFLAPLNVLKIHKLAIRYRKRS